MTIARRVTPRGVLGAGVWLAVMAMALLDSSGARAAALRGRVVGNLSKAVAPTVRPTAKVFRRYPITAAKAEESSPRWVVVAVDGPGESGAAAPTEPSVIISRGLIFEPANLAVPSGTELKIDNQDRFDLNVELTGRRLAPLKRGTSLSEKLATAGLQPLTVREWEHMHGQVLVLDGRLFSTPDSQGMFSIGDVPSGVKTVRVFIDGKEAGKTDVQVPKDAEAWVEVTIDGTGKATIDMKGSGLVPVRGNEGQAAHPTPTPKPEAPPPLEQPKPEPVKPKPEPRKPAPKPKPAEPTGGGEPPPPPPPPPPPGE